MAAPRGPRRSAAVLRGSFALAGLLASACGLSPPPPTTPHGSPPVRTPFRATPPPTTPASAPAPIGGDAFAAIPGWSEEDHAAALRAFQRGCGAARDETMRAACRRARQLAPDTPDGAARQFFQFNFVPVAVPGEGVLTAYFSPEYPARRWPEGAYTAPVRPPPTAGASAPAPADPAAGGLDPVQDLLDAPPASSPMQFAPRAAIEAAPAPDALAWMRPEDLFFLQIQGSGVLVFPDGARAKAAYAGDNGQTFTPIARAMVRAGYLQPDRAGADAIRGWLAGHPGDPARTVMDWNPRYVFLHLSPDDGRDPAGAAGVPLPPGRALAVDPSRHGYGELYWIDASDPLLSGAARRYRRLALALDTGSAIRGDVRADLYTGRGAAAGAEAGRVRHTLRLVRLVPVASAGR